MPFLILIYTMFFFVFVYQSSSVSVGWSFYIIRRHYDDTSLYFLVFLLQVLYYLVRVEPFTTLSIQLQGGKFDHADRMFSDIGGTWNGILEDMSDVKELVCVWRFSLRHYFYSYFIHLQSYVVSSPALIFVWYSIACGYEFWNKFIFFFLYPRFLSCFTSLRS